MITKRIIPCLDVKDGKVVKGINFVGLREVGDPVSLAKVYYEQGADELVFLDITATHEHRDTMVHIVEKVAAEIFMPFTVGGGIRTTDDIRRILRAGADKISLNSAAVRNPQLLTDGANMFGSQCIVLAVDGRMRADGSGWNVVINGGRIDTGNDAIEWIKEGVRRGAGEILLTSMDADGTKNGYDCPLPRAVSESVGVPVIASGGAGTLEHLSQVLTEGKADAVLAASIFHFGTCTIPQAKQFLKSRGIPVRL